ncbi:MAG TPA: NB-ARC domain-containing protein [Ktedonobacteraceae bacterium]|nr:NB-ARC domain-containing protein [Ktedonobacteraceae bacterium]
MKRSPYGEPDYAFGQSILILRSTARLTQAEMAGHLGVSRKAIGEWERGLSYPKATHLKAFIALVIGQQAFPVGREEEEIRTLWQAAHRKVPLDEEWLRELLARRKALQALQQDEEHPGAFQTLAPGVGGTRVDWGDALVVSNFYGRMWELNLLASWLVEERCRVVSVLGLGGIGKSALVTQVMHRVAPWFDVVIWRSLRDAPSCDLLLDECLQSLAPQMFQEVPVSFERRLSLLLDLLRHIRVLLVLDNLEVLLEEGQSTGHMRSGYEGYAQLLRRMAETEHQSCLLLTSREKPSDLIPHEGSRAPIRVLRLARLDVNSCEQLLAEKGITGSVSERERLIELYAGNPLALKIVAETIVEIFGGEITPFLEQGGVVFGGVREVLDEQYARLSAVEQTVLLWLAIMREPVSLDELLAMLVVSLSRAGVLEAVEALRRRSLIERGQQAGSFTLQSVVLEYVTGRLIAEVACEINQRQLALLIEHGLELATSKEYVRQAQQRLILNPLLAAVRSAYQGRSELEGFLLALLNQLRTKEEYAQGYGPANILALLRQQRGHLRGLDLSQLYIRGAALYGVEMQDTSLTGARLHETALNESFDIPWSVAISPDGQHWAAASRRGEVRVWREEGRLLHQAWKAHTDTVRALSFSPDGRTLATGSWDGSIKLWDSERGILLWSHWFTDNIECLAFSPNGSLLASGGDDAVVQIWDTRTGALLQTLLGHTGPLFALAWNPDGSLLASAGLDGAIRLWKYPFEQPEKLVQKLVGHTNWVIGLAFSPDGTQLASGSWDATVRLWNIESLHLQQTLIGDTERLRAVAWSPDGRLVASCGFDHTIWLWDVGRSYQTGLHGHSGGVYSLAFTPNSRSLLSGSEDGTLRMWNLERGQCIHILQGYAVSLFDIAWSPDGKSIASAGSNALVTIWEGEGLNSLRRLSGHRSLVYGVGWSPDGKLLASSGLDNTVCLWDAATGEIQRLFQDPDHLNTLFYGLAWSPDGSQLAVSSYYHGLQVWNVTTGTRSWKSREQLTRIRRVVWSPDGMQLASCGDDGSVCLWKASDGLLLEQLQGHTGIVMSVVWSPDGTRLASGGKELIIWNLQAGNYMQVLGEQISIVNALIWSSSGADLIIGSSDGYIRWWNVQQGKYLLVRQGHQGAVQSLCMHPDGRKLASCGDDNTIQVWDLQSGEHIRTLRQDRPYERLNITDLQGITEAQKATLLALGAIEDMAAPCFLPQ